MTAKEYLSRIIILKQRITSRIDELNEMRAMAVSISVSTDREYVQSSGSGDAICNAVANIVNAEKQLAEVISQYMQEREEAKNRIEKMDDETLREILYLRYISGKSLSAVAETMHYSDRQIIRLHGEALSKFEKDNKDVTKCH